MITPFQKFLRGLEAAQLDFNETMNELRAFAEVMARKQNSLEMDEDGLFYTSASGSVEEIIPILYKQVEKLERIKKQKDNSI
jgi:hypothetical protein